MLDSVIDRLLDAVAAGGPTAMALVMAAENVFPPIPSEAVLPLAGFAVHRGQMLFVAALAAATTGSVAGAWVLYAAGRFGGRPMLYRYERLLRLDDARLDRADAWFDRHGSRLVFWGRMVPVARSAVSVPAGMSQMPLGRFTLLTAAGSLGWNSVLVGAGMLLGSRWEEVSTLATTYSRVVVAVAVAVVALLAYAAAVRGRRGRSS